MLGLAELFDRGGPVLYILFIVTLFIWFIIFSKYLSTSYNNKNWIKNNFDTFSSGVNINRSNIHLFEESLNVSSQIWMTGTNEAAFKKLENSSKLQYFVINDSNITQLVDM